VRIIPELNQPFNTKCRAPFKIICEVIKYNDIKKKDEELEGDGAMGDILKNQ
jgi:hypothetical protein